MSIIHLLSYHTTHCHLCTLQYIAAVLYYMNLARLSGCAYRGIDVVLEYKMVTRGMREDGYNLCSSSAITLCRRFGG